MNLEANIQNTNVSVAPILDADDCENHQTAVTIGRNLRVKIDGFSVVTISFLNEYRYDLCRYLEKAGFCFVEEFDVMYGVYLRYRRYRRGSEEVGLLHQSIRFNMTFATNKDLIKLHSPRPSLVRLIGDFFQDREEALLNRIEIPVDFYCKKEVFHHVQAYLEGITLLLHSRRPPRREHSFKTGCLTFWVASEVGGCSRKGLKFYAKEDAESGEVFLRMEITLGPSGCRSFGLRTLRDVPAAWDLDLSTIIAFRRINYPKLFRHLGKSRFRDMMKKRNSEGGRPLPSDGAKSIETAVVNTITNAMRSAVVQWCEDDVERIALAEQINVLRAQKIKYGGFLESVEDGLFSHLQLAFKENGRVWRNSLQAP